MASESGSRSRTRLVVSDTSVLLPVLVRLPLRIHFTYHRNHVYSCDTSLLLLERMDADEHYTIDELHHPI